MPRTLASRIREVLGDREGYRVDRPVATADVRLKELEQSISRREAIETLAEKGGCRPHEIQAGKTRPMGRGQNSLWARLPLRAAKKAAVGGSILIGWTKTKIELLEARPPPPSAVINASRGGTCGRRTRAPRTGPIDVIDAEIPDTSPGRAKRRSNARYVPTLGANRTTQWERAVRSPQKERENRGTRGAKDRLRRAAGPTASAQEVPKDPGRHCGGPFAAA